MTTRALVAGAALALALTACRGGSSGHTTEPAPSAPAKAAPTPEKAAAPTPEKAAAPTPEKTMLTDDALIAKAREAAKGIEFSPNAGAPVITRDGAGCTVRFPIDHPKDMPVLGPDYDAEVDLDCATGKVAAVRLGS